MQPVPTDRDPEAEADGNAMGRWDDASHRSAAGATELATTGRGSTFRPALGLLQGGCALALLSAGCVIQLSPPAGDQTGPAPDSGAPPAADAAVDSAPPVVLPDGASPKWTNVTSNLSGMPSECGNLQTVFSKPEADGGDVVIAGVARHGLWATSSGGASWSPLGTGAGSAVIINRPTSLVVDPANPAHYWESGIYNGAGIYETGDDGVTFSALAGSTMTSNDLVSVDFSDPNRQTLVAGGHEQPQTLFRSADGGMTWSSIGRALPAGCYCSYPFVVNPQTYLVGCYGCPSSRTGGIYRTANGGTTWKQVTSSGGASAPLLTSSGALYWASSSGGMTTSADMGVTWTDLAVLPGSLSSVHPIELPNGELATIGSSGAPTAVVVSATHGASWRPATPPLPYPAVGLVYSAQERAFFIWYFTCPGGGVSSAPVPNDAVMRCDYDYTAN